MAMMFPSFVYQYICDFFYGNRSTGPQPVDRDGVEEICEVLDLRGRTYADAYADLISGSTCASHDGPGGRCCEEHTLRVPETLQPLPDYPMRVSKEGFKIPKKCECHCRQNAREFCRRFYGEGNLKYISN